MVNIGTLHACLAATKNWISHNYLQLNPDKTDILLIGPDMFVSEIKPYIGPMSTYIKPSPSRNMDATFDQNLNPDLHINKLVQTCFFQLWNITKIESKPSARDLQLLIHTLIFSCLDNCNILFSTQPSHTVPPATRAKCCSLCRLLNKTKCRSNITPTLHPFTGSV